MSERQYLFAGMTPNGLYSGEQPPIDDRGQRALAERLKETALRSGVRPLEQDWATAILGEHGVYLPDGLPPEWATFGADGHSVIDGAELERLLKVEAAARATRFVAEHWRDQYLRYLKENAAGGSQWAIGTHPLGLVLAALDGETDPIELGIAESARNDFRAALATDGAET